MEKNQLTQPLHTQSNLCSAVDSVEKMFRRQLLISEARGAAAAARALLFCMSSNDTLEYNDAILDAYLEALLVASNLEQQADELSQQMGGV